ncbi:hypothetical protein BH20ACI2_BH20ACI2_02280 [soil metagenome]
MFRSRRIHRSVVGLLLLSAVCGSYLFGQTPQAGKVERGSQTAKAGFKNEDDIRDKFNNWLEDADARAWLAAMNYKLADIESVRAAKPHGEKADVVVRIRMVKQPEQEKPGRPQSRKDAEKNQDETVETAEGISIKLVSSPNGFNQIDKRWLASYAKKWNMPVDVVAALKLYLGEAPPNKPSRDRRRMFLNELEPAQQTAVIDFFAANKEMIVSDLIEGDGVDAATWMMVAFKATDKPRWVIKSSREAVRHFAEGKVEMTRAGNLKIGRITMQRKGGDGGRETANMLQFKINPMHLIDAK